MAGAAPTSKPAPFLAPLDLLDRGILLAESTLSLVIVIVMVTLGVAEAIGSFFGIQHPILRAAGDVLLHGTIWAAFLGASFATRGRKHLAIDAIGRLLPDRARRVLVAISSTFGALVAGALAYGVLASLIEQGHVVDEQLAQMVESGIGAATVDHSFQFQFAIPVGFSLIAARLLLHAFHELLFAISGQKEPEPATKPVSAKSADGETLESDGHPEPDGSSQPAAEHELRSSALEQASLSEFIIAFTALLVPIPVSLGTAAAVPVLTSSLCSIALLGAFLAHRKRFTGALAATAPLDEPVASVKSPLHPVLALVGVAALFGAFYGLAQNLTSFSIGAGIAFFAVAALLGAPLFTFLGGLALFLWLHGADDVPITPLANAVEDVLGPHFARMSVLPTIPIFTLAGYLMSESNTPKRLVRVARALLGFAPGGLAIVCVLASAFFTVFSGASGITIVAIGGLLLPALLKDRYPEKFSLGLVTTGGALGITFPPALPLIVYGIVAGLQEVPPGVERLELQRFLFAGVGPGVLIIAMLIVYAMIQGVLSGVPRSKFDRSEAAAALWEAKWELALPLVVTAGLIVAGPGGAAAFTAFYVLVIEVFIYKDLSLTRDIPRIVPDSMVLVGAIFVKLCAATVLTFYFVQAQTADKLFEVLTCGEPAREYLAAHSDVMVSCREAVDALAARHESAGGLIDSQITFLIALNFFLLIVGMLMDIFSAIVVIVPLIMGIALHFDVNPYHLGIVFLLNLEIGYLMPPMGLNLFIAGFRFGKPVPALYPVVLPFIGVFIAALLITTYVPSLTLMLVPGAEAAQVHHEEAAGDLPGPSDSATPPPTDETAEEGGCDVPREGESFEDFESRCSNGGGAAAPADCDVPREGESFEDFESRCEGGSVAPAAPAGPPPDCDLPRENESFEDFERRCEAGAEAAAPAAPAAPSPDCDLPRENESFEAFQARCPT